MTPVRMDAAEALRTLPIFTREQMAWIAAQVQRWAQEATREEALIEGFIQGYALCEKEWNAAAGRALATVSLREHRETKALEWLRDQRDKASRTPRENDHRGGPAKMWDNRDQAVA